MEVPPNPPSAKGPDQWFTGEVWIDAIVRGEEPSRIRVNAVHFAPGARTAWHSHALGQTLYITEGEGRVQSRGEDIVTIRSGDIDAQFRTTKGPGARREWAWMRRATTSLPEPAAPEISTRLLVGATRSIACRS